MNAFPCHVSLARFRAILVTRRENSSRPKRYDVLRHTLVSGDGADVVNAYHVISATMRCSRDLPGHETVSLRHYAKHERIWMVVVSSLVRAT